MNLSQISIYASTKDPSQVKTINPLSETSYTPTNVPCINKINISSETLRGDPTGSLSSIPAEQPSSKPGDQSISDPCALKRYIQ